ncbi:type II toxin-antitoxin system antitoxin SocA domain-containing protein [Dyadobacter sp. CY343]|uniref:type II toxin-antitoxin system antitoxin SocA domain-containing protein n=1 Tax=Dyadobacter sp. CY343 TaxID=2907299 RepID=UPI001F417D8F|nr:type II toxin-antitoxin system antitoxin SocA domain-containing protein [Dyadobacter sp. CY343]MCE7062558.1 DUF4065 domain-containing protein [Dyadobacter sp. CY343]
MESPITGKEMQVRREVAALSFRKEEFKIISHYYFCEDSGEKFTNDNLDNLNLNQVYNQYREKYGIPFPDEIRQLRTMYDVSASKMSEILGLGPNSFRLYEAGEMPSVAIGRLLLSIKQPAQFIKQVKASSHLLTPKETDRLLRKGESLMIDQKNHEWDIILTDKIFESSQPCEYNGYRVPDLHKISNMICYFNDVKQIQLYKTKLNKLLFYADFNSYKLSGYSMSGMKYRAIQFGPVPSHFDKLYIKLCDDGQLTVNEKDFGNGYYGDEIQSKSAFNDSYFSKVEISILESVAEMLGELSTDEIVKESHEESGWKENHESRSLISYKYAFELAKAINCKFDIASDLSKKGYEIEHDSN